MPDKLPMPYWINGWRFPDTFIVEVYKISVYKLAVIFDYDNKPKYNTTNANGYVLCELDDLNEEYTETEHTENAERVQCAQQ